MPIPIVQSATQEKIFSPFSGLPVDGDGIEGGSDATLLFAYYGGGSVWGYVSSRVSELIGDSDIEELDAEGIADKLDLPGAFILEVDTGWNGVNFYCFAPAAA